MEQKPELLKAIECYDVYSAQGRNVLKTIIAAAGEDYTAKLTIASICDISKVSRQGVYNCLRYIVKDNFLEVEKTSGRKISLFKLNPNKLEEVINYYKTINSVKKSLQ